MYLFDEYYILILERILQYQNIDIDYNLALKDIFT